MKKFISLILILAVVLSLCAFAVSAETALPSGSVLTVTGDPVNLRYGPGSGYGKAATTRYGQTMTAIASQADSSGRTWYKVSYNGSSLWITSQFSKVAAGASAPTAAPSQPTGATVTVNATPVNVRKGAGTSYGKLGSSKKGDVFQVLGTANASDGVKWYKISFGGSTGFIMSTLVTYKAGTAATTTAAQTPTPVAPADYAASGTVTAASSANVRAGAGESFALVGTASKGQTFTVCGYSNASNGVKWYKICYGKGYGYLSSSACTGQPTSSTAKPTTKPTTAPTNPGSVKVVPADHAASGTVTCAYNSVEVRAGAGESYALIGAAKLNDSFTVCGWSHSASKIKWYKICFGKGYGYVSAERCSFVPASPVSVRPADSALSGVASVTGTLVNVRTGAGEGYEQIGSAQKGQTFTVCGSSKASNGSQWYKICFGKGYGYIAAGMCSFTKTTYDHADVQSPNRKSPYYIIVYRDNCKVLVLGKDAAGKYNKQLKVFTCSVGKGSGNTTPTGLYAIDKRYDWRLMFGDVYAQYAVRFYGNYLFHSVPYTRQSPSTLEMEEYEKLGSPASLGCVRMCVRDCKWIYDNAPNGTQVRVVGGKNGPDATESIPKLNYNSKYYGWDPTDPNPNNPYNK